MDVLTLSIAVLAGLLAIWLLGGMLLRIGGLTLVCAGGVGAGVQGDASGVLVLVIGTLLWLVGHWHYALRHQHYKSPLAGYVFLRWAPGWLEPTRNWAVPMVEDDRAGSRGRLA